MTDDLERDLDLMALAEGGKSLTPERKKQLESAIADSAELAARYEATRLVLEHVDHMPDAAPSMGFSKRLERRLDAIDHERSRGWGRWLSLPSWPTPTIWASAVAVAATGLFLLVRSPRPGPSTDRPGPLAQVELLEVAENLDLLRNLEIVEQLDILEDLEIIESLDAEDGPG